MTEDQLQHFAMAIAELSFWFGVLGGLAFSLLGSVCRWVVFGLDRRADKQARIRDARWRARWNGHMREAAELGFKGRRAIAHTVNAMKTEKQAAMELLDA